MTFIVERPHPGFKKPEYSRNRDKLRSASAELLKLLPFPLDIEDTPFPRRGYVSECDCGTVYRVSSEGVRILGKYQVLCRGLSENSRPFVCSCMGHME